MRYIFIPFFLFSFFCLSQEITIKIKCKDIHTNRNISSVQLFKKTDSLLLGETSYNGVQQISNFQLDELKDTLCFRHPNYTFEDIPLNNYESLINEAKELVITVYGHDSYVYHTLNLNVTRTNRIDQDSISLKVIDIDTTISQEISFLPNHQDIAYPFKKNNNQYLLNLPMDKVRNGLIIIDKPGRTDTLLFDRKNALQTIFINSKGLNKKASIYARSNIVQYFKMLDSKNQILAKHKKEARQQIKALEIELEKCKGEYIPEPEIDHPYPREVFFRIKPENKTVLPEDGFDGLKTKLTAELNRLRIKKQTMVKILLKIGTDGLISFKIIDGSKNTDIYFAIKSVLKSNKWVFDYSGSHKLKHNVCLILNLIPK